MPYHTKLPHDLKEVDVIVAGGGLAGCVVAGRLAEADPKLQILVIEQGPNNYGLPEVVYPALYPRVSSVLDGRHPACPVVSDTRTISS